MKSFFLPLVVIFSSFATVRATATEDPNYVVIGAFSIHTNAVKFTNRAKNEDHLSAKYDINKSNKLYYVYVMTTDNHDAAIAEAKRLRNSSRYEDAWVYQGPLGENSIVTTTSRDVNPVTKNEMADVSNQDVSSPTDSQTATESIEPVKEDEKPQPKPEPEDDGTEGKRFVFKIFRGTDEKEVQGDIDVLDIEKGRKLATYKGNTEVKMKPPGKTPSVNLLCNVFGYRKIQKTIDYNNPVADDVTTDEDGNIVVPFELVRLQKGDIAVMYNVYFYNDAAIMRPESRYEVNTLLDMMKENPSYKIRLHGHTNGGGQGKLITMGETDNFFTLTGSVNGFGSAKALSEERARVISEYLAANGIDPKRMEIKAWGGKRPIFDKHHAKASENVRVEVEILQHE
jgi:outer membrane protein OmpA-like peptidoglycan-associated protein